MQLYTLFALYEPDLDPNYDISGSYFEIRTSAQWAGSNCEIHLWSRARII